MVSLDRVGVRGPEVPICHGGRGPVRVRDELEAAARRTETPHTVCGDNTTSDHWSFERAGLPGARLGSVPYAGYHSGADTTDVISAGQLSRVGRIMVAWLRS
jgi:Zn-dependent M28 family amino/carboxypeptidase